VTRQPAAGGQFKIVLTDQLNRAQDPVTAFDIGFNFRSDSEHLHFPFNPGGIDGRLRAPSSG
jgi:hypothetical protein